MNQAHLDVLLRQRRHHIGFQVSNEQVVLVPFTGESGTQVAAAFACTVTDARQGRCTVVLGYSTARKSAADRSTDADHFFLQMGHPFLEGSLERERAVQRCLLATKNALLPRFPVQERFATLKQESERVSQLIAQLDEQLARDGDFLAATANLQSAQTLLGWMQLRAANLNETRETREAPALRDSAEALTQAMMRNYAHYPAATIAKFMATPSQPLTDHLSVQHAMWAISETKVLVELKRRYRQAHHFLSEGTTGL